MKQAKHAAVTILETFGHNSDKITAESDITVRFSDKYRVTEVTDSFTGANLVLRETDNNCPMQEDSVIIVTPEMVKYMYQRLFGN